MMQIMIHADKADISDISKKIIALYKRCGFRFSVSKRQVTSGAILVFGNLRNTLPDGEDIADTDRDYGYRCNYRAKCLLARMLRNKPIMGISVFTSKSVSVNIRCSRHIHALSMSSKGRFTCHHSKKLIEYDRAMNGLAGTKVRCDQVMTQWRGGMLGATPRAIDKALLSTFQQHRCVADYKGITREVLSDMRYSH